MNPGIPAAIGGYELGPKLSSGGMGSVYLSTRRGSGGFEKRVAIKVVLSEYLGHSEILQLFTDEARLAAQLDHPNICQVFDFGCDQGVHFLVMEYLEGCRVLDILRAQRALGSPLPQVLAARIVADAARGLHYAHERRGGDGRLLGVVHRDISPENLFVTTSGCTKVLDFGIATWADRISVTRQGVVRGKASYMSPEQVHGEPVDRRTDVFSLGILLYELVTGAPLFRRESPIEAMQAVCEAPIADPRERVPGLLPTLHGALMHALERDRQRRTSTAQELAQGLDAVLQGMGSSGSTEALASHLRQCVRPSPSSARAVHAPSPRPADGAGPEPRAARTPGTVNEAAPQARPAASETEPLSLSDALGVSQPTAGSDGQSTTSTAPMRPEPRAWQGGGWRLVLVAGALAGAVALAWLAWLAWQGDRAGVGDARGPDPQAASGPPGARAHDGGGNHRALAAGVDAARPGDAGLSDREGLDGSSPGGTSPAPAHARPKLGRPRARPGTRGSVDVGTASPAPPAMGTLSVFASPWANVRVDGETRGPTPLLGLRLPAGQHLVELLAPDTNQVQRRRVVQVPARQELRVEFPGE